MLSGLADSMLPLLLTLTIRLAFTPLPQDSAWAQALRRANLVAGFAHYNPHLRRSQNPSYLSLLQANLANITNGYNAYVSGKICKR